MSFTLEGYKGMSEKGGLLENPTQFVDTVRLGGADQVNRVSVKMDELRRVLRIATRRYR